MIYDNQPLMELIEKGKETDTAIKDILELIDEDSETYEIAKLLKARTSTSSAVRPSVHETTTHS